MSSLATPLRRQLESAVGQARKLAEAGAVHALQALAVHEPDPYRHMDEAARTLRRQLRAQARQLGDGETRSKPGAYEIKHLAEKLAYDQWHRLLFARYLLENNLLISPEHGVAVTLEDCEELAPSIGCKDAWAVAARFAAKELPDIFRGDDPAGAVELAVNDRLPLIALVTGLPVEVFTASDSLGWCYQFWQAEKKDEVNAAGNKIGADELPAVTQLFTEDYMVDFLLDNTLGAWHAGKVLAARPELAKAAESEAELREAVALPGCPWTYLRFTQGDDGAWAPASGTFDGWPRTAKELKCLDPCMGSGHFVVAMFERVVALRITEEGLDEAEAVAAVVGENLFGLELDPRCTQIGAFNLALAAWRRVGHCVLPAMNIACSGLAPNAKRAEWLKLAGGDDRLERGMARLYASFADAPALGSLINPRAGEGDLIVAAFHELQPLLATALAQEARDDVAHEMAVTARGVAKAAEILAGRFTLVATNVPYLKSGKQESAMQEHCVRHYGNSKGNLACVFVERCLEFCSAGSTFAGVVINEMLFLVGYRKLREDLLTNQSWQLIAKLGAGAFETINGEVVNVSLIAATRSPPTATNKLFAIDAGDTSQPRDKADWLQKAKFPLLSQKSQLLNPDARLKISEGSSELLLSAYCDFGKGSVTGDGNHYLRMYWELPAILPGYRPWLNSPTVGDDWSGREHVVMWEVKGHDLRGEIGHMIRGDRMWGNKGVAICKMSGMDVCLYSGELFDDNIGVLLPNEPNSLPTILEFAKSPAYRGAIREIDQAIKVTAATLVKVPFDLAHWQRVAAEKYPHGLPNRLLKYFPDSVNDLGFEAL